MEGGKRERVNTKERGGDREKDGDRADDVMEGVPPVARSVMYS